MADRSLNALVLQKSEVAPGLMIIRVAPDGWELPDFTPGQFAVLGLPGAAVRCPESDQEQPLPDPDRIVLRAYSIASSSVARQYLEFYITLVHSGSLTPRLFHLGIGDPVWLGPRITGRFTLDDVPAGASVALIATGTGIAPYMSMVRTILGQQDRRGIAVIHGARHSWDLGYSSELIALERVCPVFSYIPIVSAPDGEPVPWGGLTGYAQDAWKGGVLADKWGFQPTPADTHVLLCGNPTMIQTMEGILQEEGYAEHTPKSPGQYHVEKYW
jgi:ferredoxin--NADP+ reductase